MIEDARVVAKFTLPLVDTQNLKGSYGRTLSTAYGYQIPQTYSVHLQPLKAAIQQKRNKFSKKSSCQLKIEKIQFHKFSRRNSRQISKQTCFRMPPENKEVSYSKIKAFENSITKQTKIILQTATCESNQPVLMKTNPSISKGKSITSCYHQYSNKQNSKQLGHLRSQKGKTNHNRSHISGTFCNLLHGKSQPIDLQKLSLKSWRISEGDIQEPDVFQLL